MNIILTSYRDRLSMTNAVADTDATVQPRTPFELNSQVPPEKLRRYRLWIIRQIFWGGQWFRFLR